ncbi:MAG: DUF262 domain-containing protein [Candidatus Caldarchaeum sp.]
MVELSKLYEDLEMGYYVVPEIQRPFVWRNQQVVALANSIFNKLPIGAIFICEIPNDLLENYENLFKPLTDDLKLANGRYMVIDGRQRLTSLLLLKYGRIQIGGKQRHVQIYFNPLENDFILARGKRKPGEYYFPVPDILTKDTVWELLESVEAEVSTKNTLQKRLERLRQIFNTYQMPIVSVEMDWKNSDLLQAFDRVSHMFVNLNDRGTKVKLPDLVLALLTGKTVKESGGVFRQRFQKFLDELAKNDYDVNSPPLIRTYMAISTGETRFREAKEKLERFAASQLMKYLDDTKTAVMATVKMLREYGVRHKYLKSSYSLVIPSFFIHRHMQSKTYASEEFKKALVRWIILASFNWRYTGRLEGDLKEDIEMAKKTLNPAELITNLRIKDLSEDELSGEYDENHINLLSVIYAVNGARDWDIQRTQGDMLKDLNDEEISIHHIFPVEHLEQKGVKEEVLKNDVANITIISKKANQAIGDKTPESYLSELRKKDPTLLERHLIPSAEKLLKAEHYEDFLKERRRLIINEFHKHFKSQA